MDLKKRHSVSNNSVDRALDILILIADNNIEGLVFSDIARQLEIPKSSLTSLLASLEKKSFLTYHSKEKCYYLGEELFNLGNRFVDNSNILSTIEKILSNTMEKTSYTTFFGVLSGNEVRYLLKKVSNSQFEALASPQYALKASCTGLGKAMLLDYSKEEIEKLFSGKMPKVTAHTITSTQELYDQLIFMRQKDIAFEKEESSPNIQCKAMPIRYKGKIIAAVSISFPMWMNDEDEIKEIESALVEEKSQIEKLISQNARNWIFSDLG